MFGRPDPYTPRGLGRMGGHLKVMCSGASCTHETQVMPMDLIQKGYGDIHLDVITRRLKCVRCGAVRPTVQFQFW